MVSSSVLHVSPGLLASDDQSAALQYLWPDAGPELARVLTSGRLPALPDLFVRLSRAPVVSIVSIRGRASGVGSEDLGYSHRDLPSQAGHDAPFMARIKSGTEAIGRKYQ